MFLRRPAPTILLFSLVSSIGFVVVSVVLIVYGFPQIVMLEVNKEVKLERNTEQYDRFLEVPIPIYFKIYIFEVENPEKVMKGEKPELRERGPYVYREYRKKNVEFTNDTDDTLSYYQSISLEFDATASGNLSDEDVVTVLNIPLLSILETMEDTQLHSMLPLVSKCLQSIFADLNSLFIEVKVKDLLIDGLKFCAPKLSLCEVVRDITCKMIAKRKNIIQNEDGSLKFRLLDYKINNQDLWTINKGLHNIENVGYLTKLNNASYTKIWGGDTTCDRVKGHDGTTFPPHLTPDSNLDIYTTDICRSIHLKFLHRSTYKSIMGLTYTFDNSTLIDENSVNSCYCTKATRGVYDEKNCYLDGVLDLQSCQEAPLLLSYPHFLWADDHYKKDVRGMNPNASLHSTFFTIEPNTGIPLQGSAKTQINVVLRPIAVKNMQNVARAVLPIIWMDESFELTDDLLDTLNDKYFHKIMLLTIIEWTLLASSLILTTALAICYYKKNCKNK